MLWLSISCVFFSPFCPLWRVHLTYLSIYFQNFEIWELSIGCTYLKNKTKNYKVLICYHLYFIFFTGLLRYYRIENHRDCRRDFICAPEVRITNIFRMISVSPQGGIFQSWHLHWVQYSFVIICDILMGSILGIY